MSKLAMVTLLTVLVLAMLAAGGSGLAFGHGISHNGCTAVEQAYSQYPELAALLDPVNETACEGYAGPVYLP